MHTPGPWKYHKNNADYYEIEVDYTTDRFIPDLATTFPHEDVNPDMPNKEVEANTCLMATSPELLEALEEALEMAEMDAQHDLEKYKRVINKAKGL